jgi:cadmium resistance protein CadD (predicted permease)
MDHLASLIGIGAVAFVSTNIDDLLVLVGFFADRRYRRMHVVVGQFAGIGALIVVSLVGSLLSLAVPTSYIGLIGFLPIVIGLHRLVRRRGEDVDGSEPAQHASRVATVALVTISTGSDNLGLYIPLFSIHSDAEIAIFVVIFLGMTALWCAAGCTLVGSRLVGGRLQHWGDRALPYVMVGLGLYIMTKSDAWTLLTRWPLS